MGLWDVLASDPDPQNIANVKWLVEYAEGKLLLIRETFPDYTRHDARHSKNVIALAEKLLGPAVESLRPLEAAMLILAAYFHDIGMAYSPGELAAVAEEQDFRDFLDENPAAYVQVHKVDQAPRDVLVQYARARHADRATELLFQLSANKRSWDGVGIGTELGTLCQSHMQSLEELRSGRFSTDFLGTCDLRMCAIILRLADILDLDDTRAPAAIYSHLRLSGEAEGPRATSNTEWSKHIVSRGFRYPEARDPSYPLLFLASPQKPSVEHSIRKFLDVVEEELHGCRILLDFCDQRWQALVLPGRIDRSGIISDGYHYGEYRFNLDRHEVLGLFMGDKLYDDPYTFIRELLQNAIDACRLNCYLHDANPTSMEIRVSTWEDQAGYYWFRIDDTGIGMDQEIVEKYFLGVGRSYYRSEELQADILRKNKPHQPFVAISRFGIGALSSFIVGDKVEVSTRRRLFDGKLANPLRLSLDSLEDFFVMQAHPMRPAPFPSKSNEEIGYRRNSGTSVAVRIDPAKSDVVLEELLERARKSLFFPPVRIFYNGVEEHGCELALLDNPFLDEPVRHRLTDDESEVSIRLLAVSELSVILFPLDLTAYSPSENVCGQLLAVGTEVTGSASLLPALPRSMRRRIPGNIAADLKNCISRHHTSGPSVGGYSTPYGFTVSVHLELDLELEVIKDFVRWLEESGEYQNYDDIYETLNKAIGRSEESLRGRAHISGAYRVDFSKLIKNREILFNAVGWLGHNGISVPTRIEDKESLDDTDYTLFIDDRLSLSNNRRFTILGPVCLFDELRPDVSISRDSLRDVPFAVRSAVQLAVRRAASAHLGSPEKDFATSIMQLDLMTQMQLGEISTGQIDSDPLMSAWRTEDIIPVDSRKVSVAEARSLAISKPATLMLSISINRKFYETLQAAIAELELDLEWSDTGRSRLHPGKIIVTSAGRPARLPGLSIMPSFTALRYNTSSDILIVPRSPANLRNPIVAWFANQAELLSSEYPALFAQFRRALKIGDALTAADAAELLNTTLGRIRRAIPDAPDVLAREIYPDASGQLRSR